MLSSSEAIRLLERDLIFHKSDWLKYENRWLLHCYYVGEAAYRIGKKIGLSEDKCDFLKALGYVHDIGRKIDHSNHVIEGYNYLNKCGQSDASFICLTHSFINCDLNLTAGLLPKGKKYKFLKTYLDVHKESLYDNIIQLCDLFCSETGFKTIEARLLDITKRKGAFSTSKKHLEKTFELKAKIEKYLNCNLYDLFPEIDQADLFNKNKDCEEIISMINSLSIENN